MKKLVAALTMGLILGNVAFAESKVIVFNDSQDSKITIRYCIFHTETNANICHGSIQITLDPRGKGNKNYKEFVLPDNTYGLQILDANNKYGTTDFTMKHCQTRLVTDEHHLEKWNAISLDDHGGEFITCALEKYTPKGEN
jgi:hypothetical protein